VFDDPAQQMRQGKAADTDATPKGCSLAPGCIGKEDFTRSLRPEIETPARELQCPVTDAMRDSSARTWHEKPRSRVEHTRYPYMIGVAIPINQQLTSDSEMANLPLGRTTSRSSGQFDRSTLFLGAAGDPA
jgi:hypothetical protein